MFFKIYSFGCKVNQYESEFIKQIMCADGYYYTDTDCNADIFIVNSCSVTAVSDSKCRKLLRKLRRENPASVILLCGCMSQAFPRKYENFEMCDIVTGNTTRAQIPQYIKEFLTNREQIVDVTDHDRKNEGFEPCVVSDFSERTRAFVKIEDGCDRFCSYCIIPYARGRVRSKPLDELSHEVSLLAENGYKEIVLVGINLSKYGTDIGLTLSDAVECVAEHDGICRIRLGSLEPELLDDDTIRRLSAVDKFCPQFHLSLQSGCTETLKRMNRRYSSSEYAEIVDRIRSNFDNPSITTDVMVGFPGETEEEFKASLDFVTRIGFAKVHVFPYSRRSGTVADRMPDQISRSVKEQRARLMTEANELKRIEFMKSQIGAVCEVLFERADSNGMFEGYSKNYIPVYVNTNGIDISGECRKVLLTAVDGERCAGELLNDGF
ncbi:MAG: tRNA (N(6)-L-threonylcarbamoyladenosine(37)-C(2))-methylthiotransferase MtaB [Ruminococcus sp.]|nr:tRNA (N(6)-L-threonylcarbamoyladenosine(37)-C(2))-methylthiotransferase MtaB [Ruminococcus sp.]